MHKDKVPAVHHGSKYNTIKKQINNFCFSTENAGLKTENFSSDQQKGIYSRKKGSIPHKINIDIADFLI